MERNEQMLAIQAALGDIIDNDPSRVDGPAGEAPSERQPVFPDSDDESPPTQLPQENIHETGDGSMLTASGTLESNMHGHFELINLITQLDQKLEALRSQETMLSALIRKADLTGDVHKLPLLRKSKDAMDREMSELTFQKAQLEQQQAENSLVPGRTKACIISAAPEEEDGKSVIRYLIEVKQTGVDNNNVSGWVVARRYNEFLSMHQRLKDKHAVVRTLEFPGKSLVTSLSTTFVEARKAALEKYLQVRAFLTGR
jgi:sorting nexin-25